MRKDARTSSSVSGKNWRIEGKTGCWTEFVPQLPVMRFWREVVYWTDSGLSNPKVTTHAWTAPGVRAFVHAAQGFGTATCVKKKVIVTTPKRTGTSWSRRFPTKTIKSLRFRPKDDQSSRLGFMPWFSLLAWPEFTHAHFLRVSTGTAHRSNLGGRINLRKYRARVSTRSSCFPRHAC